MSCSQTHVSTKGKGDEISPEGNIDNYKYLCPFQKTQEKITEK